MTEVGSDDSAWRQGCQKGGMITARARGGKRADRTEERREW